MDYRIIAVDFDGTLCYSNFIKMTIINVIQSTLCIYITSSIGLL